MVKWLIMQNVQNWLLHRLLKRPYLLHVRVDEGNWTRPGQPIAYIEALYSSELDAFRNKRKKYFLYPEDARP